MLFSDCNFGTFLSSIADCCSVMQAHQLRLCLVLCASAFFDFNMRLGLRSLLQNDVKGVSHFLTCQWVSRYKKSPRCLSTMMARMTLFSGLSRPILKNLGFFKKN